MDDSHNDLCWRDLAVSVAGKILLNDCHGIARAGRLMGILGPSGAGKSTLLSALSGTLQRRYHVSGHIWSNHGRRVGVSEGTVALLAQDDPFFLELTVFETLCYASRLAGQSYAQAQQEADSLLQRVGLAAASSRRVDHTTKGEQRRLAVACAIAGEGQEGRGFSAQALLADEPTTGLDAFQAQRVAELLKELAVTRKCVAMCSLHQPRSSMWRCLEDLLVMAPGGFVVYCGRTSEMPNYFSSLGHSCAEGAVNPAEFVIDLVSIDHESQTQAMKDRLRIEKLDFSWRRTSENLVPLSFRKVASLKSWKRSMKRSSTRALMLLVKRAMLQMGRDHLTNALRLLATAGLALVFGLHFGRLDGGGLPTARSVAARICLVSFGVIAMAMLAMARAVDRFAKERAIVHRERLSRCYSGFVYLLSKAVTELPLDALAAALFAAILHHVCGMHARREEVVMAFSLVAVASSSLGLAVGALAPSAERAMAIGGPVMIVHMLTGVIDPAGQVGHSDGQFMEMMQRLSPIRYAIEALCVAELGGLDLARSAAEAPRMGGLALVKSGDEVLRRLGITNDFEASTDWLLRLSALHLFIAAVALAAQPQVAQLEAVIMEVASKLPIERAERIAKVFERVDENHDGGISLEELQRLFVSMGLKDKALHAKAFETLDINGDGVLSFSEFAAGVLTVFSDLLEERFLELFRRHDLDSDGRLSRSELEVFLEKVLPLANRSVQQSPDPVIDSLVGNHDLVTFEELKDKLLPKRQARRK